MVKGWSGEQEEEGRGGRIFADAFQVPELGIGCGKEGVQCLQGLVCHVWRYGRDKHLDSNRILNTYACKHVCVKG